MADANVINRAPTMADRLRELGGGGLPEPALEAFHQRELTIRALQADRKISDAYRNEQLAALDDETDRALREARDRDVEAALKELASREGAILAEIRGTTKNIDRSLETSDAQRERHARGTRGALALLSDQLTAQALADPDELRDLVDEAIEGGHAERVRHLGPIALAQLANLTRQKAPGAEQAYRAVFGALSTWRRQNPSPMTRLRDVRAERDHVTASIDRKYQQTRDHFRFGAAAHGIRM
jgi:hypothetical protein